MNKKTVVIISAIIAIVFVFAACGTKKDIGDQPAQNAQTDTAPANEGTADTKDNMADTKDNETTTPKGDKTPSGDSASVSGEKLVELIDTFNNSSDEEAKEAAREQIEAILAEAEKQAK